METAVQSYKVLTMVGKSPFANGAKETVGGEETDGAITNFNLGIIGIVALVAIASGSEYEESLVWCNIHNVTMHDTCTDILLYFDPFFQLHP